MFSTQATKADDDDFQDFQEAPKAGAGDQAFTEFQGDSGGSFPTTIAPQHQNRYSTVKMISWHKLWIIFQLLILAE